MIPGLGNCGITVDNMGVKEISLASWGHQTRGVKGLSGGNLNRALVSVRLDPEHMEGLVQERCNSIANALELHLSCTNPST